MNTGRPSQASATSSRSNGKKSLLMKPGKKSATQLSIGQPRNQLKPSASQSSIQIVHTSAPLATSSGYTPRHQRTEFASLVSQTSPGAVSARVQHHASGPTSNNNLQLSGSQRQNAQPPIRPSQTSNRSSNKQLNTKSSKVVLSYQTLPGRHAKAFQAKEQALAKPILTKLQKQNKKPSSNLALPQAQGNNFAINLTANNLQVPKQYNPSPPTSIRAPRRSKALQQRTSSALGGSSKSNTVINFCGDNSVQPSSQTHHRKEQIVNQLPYQSHTTKLGSFQLHSAQSDSFLEPLGPGAQSCSIAQDSNSNVVLETRNHSVGRTPFESSKPTIEKSSKGAQNGSTSGLGGNQITVADGVIQTRHVVLNLSPRGRNSSGAYQAQIQTVNQSYTLSTKQLRQSKASSAAASAFDPCAQKQGPYQLFKTSSPPANPIAVPHSNAIKVQNQNMTTSEDGQIQISDLEPLSNRVAVPMAAYQTGLVDLKRQQSKKRNAHQNDVSGAGETSLVEQAGTSSIQIDTTSLRKHEERKSTHLIESQHDRELNELARADASFESPDVLEAARRRRVQKAKQSCIQVLPSSLIAHKKTSTTIKQQILLQSAQSYLLMSTCQSVHRPNPRIQMFQQRSPMAVMTASLEESLRCSKLSSYSRGAASETDGGENITDRYLRERDSITLDVRVEQLRSTERAAQTKQRHKGLESSNKQHHPIVPKMFSEVASVPQVTIELPKLQNQPSLKTETCIGQSREESLQAALNEIRRNTQRSAYNTNVQKHYNRQSMPSQDISHLKLLHYSDDRSRPLQCSPEQLEETTSAGKLLQQHSTDRTKYENYNYRTTQITSNRMTAISANKSKDANRLSSTRQHGEVNHTEDHFKSVNSRNGNVSLVKEEGESVPQMPPSSDFLMVTDWTEKLNENGNLQSSHKKQLTHEVGSDGDPPSRLQCLTSMETMQTQIQQVEGGILLTESCTDGEAVVAAETDEFYAAAAAAAAQACLDTVEDGVDLCLRQDSSQKAHSTQVLQTETSSGNIELPADTIDIIGQESEPLETVQTATENEDLILENVQNFINMAYLQKAYLAVELLGIEPVRVEMQPGKRLLLLDMDETLIHAATTADIEINQIYGPDARPDFYTSFEDQGTVIQIGVFKRPHLRQLLERATPYFQICIYTASEQMYADAILDVLDPHKNIFCKRIYRNQCLQAVIPSNANHPMHELLQSQESLTNKGSRMQESHSSASEPTLRPTEDPDATEHESRTVYIKDLRVLEGVDLSQVVIVDNQLLSFALQPDNGIPISSYFFDPADAELKYVADYLLEKYELEVPGGGVADIREVNKQQFKLSSIIEHALKAQSLAAESSQQKFSSSYDCNHEMTERVSTSQDELAGSHLLLTTSSAMYPPIAGSQNVERRSIFEERQSTSSAGSPTKINSQNMPSWQQQQYRINQESKRRTLIEQRYAMNLQKAKLSAQSEELPLLDHGQKAQRKKRKQSCQNADIHDFIAQDDNEIDHEGRSSAWQQATSVLDQPCTFGQQMAPPHGNSAENFSQLTNLQMERQQMAHLYQVCGQTSTGQIIRYPLQTQIVAEVPESLETSQKRDRKKSYFPHGKRNTGSQLRDSTTECEVQSRLTVFNRSQSQYSARDSGTSSNRFQQQVLMVVQPYNLEKSLESPIGRKVGLAQSLARGEVDESEMRTSSIELFGAATIAAAESSLKETAEWAKEDEYKPEEREVLLASFRAVQSAEEPPFSRAQDTSQHN